MFATLCSFSRGPLKSHNVNYNRWTYSILDGNVFAKLSLQCDG